MMIDWYEIRLLFYRLLAIAGLAVGMFLWGRNVGQDIADPHQCVSVCVEYFEQMGC